jgi:protein-tyrosine-phosphatase
MAEPLSRKSDELRRVLFLCDENYHESRFCEELFNSHARIESLNWQATSRAVQPEPAARNPGPMSLAAVECLRALGAAPVNHLRLPLEATHFDFQMSDVVIVLDVAWLAEIEKRWARHAHRIEYWSLPPSAERHSQATLMHLARDLRTYATSLQGRPRALLASGLSPARHCSV